jgi:hypothetical protein
VTYASKPAENGGGAGIEQAAHAVPAWVWLALVGAVIAHTTGARRLKEQGKPRQRGLSGVLEAIGAGVAHGIGRLVNGLLAAVWRFLTGRPLWGQPKSTATFWRPGQPVQLATPTAQLGAVAVAGPAPEPVDWAALGKRAAHALRLPPGAGRAAAATLRALQAVYGPLTTVGRGLRRWHQWRGAARAAARVAALAALVGLGLAPGWTLLGLALAVPVVLALAALWGEGYSASDAERYGPAVWAAMVQVLRLGAEDQALGADWWVRLPDDLSAEDARIVVRLPLHWLGSDKERELMRQVLHSRVPGEWVASYHQYGNEPYAEFTPKPKPKARPELPSSVEWRPSDSAYRVFIGQAIEGETVVDVEVSTETDTPHWGVSGDTGSGKSTVLYIPVVHGRQHGWVVDILDNKQNSMIKAEGHSGVRIHKTTRACMGAFAEFLTSMIAAEHAIGRDGSQEMRDLLVPRLLVIDELPTLIRFAYTWWKHGIKQKGAPPFIDWFTIILMMGRSSNHRVVVGAQQFDNALFGGTIGRKQIGTKIVIGKQDMVSWGVAFGQNAPRFGYDTEVKGRGAYADKRPHPDGEDYSWVREFQAAYITPHVHELLEACEPAPAWHDRGEMAPWITPQALAQAQEEAAARDFLPGGLFGPRTATVPAQANRGVEGVSPRSEAGTGPSGTPSGTAAGTAAGPALTAAEELAEDQALPETYALSEVCKKGWLPWSYETARKYLYQRSEKRGVAIPEGITDGKVTYYTEAEIKEWLAAWNAAKENAK